MSQSTVEPPVAPFHFGLEYIRGHFGTNTALATQQMTHNVFRSNPKPLVDHILACLDLTGHESVLDVGCGNGFILRDVVSRLRGGGRAVALDISPSMLELAEQNVTVCWVPLEFTEGVAQDLSRFQPGEFERVMANFLFHYVEEPDVVCGQLAAVTSETGRAVVTIEARESMPEMYALHFAAMAEVGFEPAFIDRLPRGRRGRMTQDNAQEVLDRHFGSVQEHPYEDELRFFDADPFMTFYATGHRFCGARAMAGTDLSDELFDDLYAAVRRRVEERIEQVGHFTLSKTNSVFVCTTRRAV